MGAKTTAEYVRDRLFRRYADVVKCFDESSPVFIRYLRGRMEQHSVACQSSLLSQEHWKKFVAHFLLQPECSSPNSHNLRAFVCQFATT